MNTKNIDMLRELDELVEAARLLGATQAKKGFGCHTDEDRRFERAMYESIDRHRAALLDWEAKQPAAVDGSDAQAAEIEALRAEVERLRTDLMESDEIREKLGHLLTRTAAALKGEPPAGVWHSWHDLPEKAAQLAERVQRDEALLRQALDVLEELQYAVVSTAKTDDVSMYYRAIVALSERLAEPTCKQSLQVAKQQEPEHISSPECWCEPELDFKDPETGAEVWVHKELQ